MDKVEVGMGRIYIATAPTILSTNGIGSCIAVCLWSQIDKRGGLAHIMLPKRPESLGSSIVEDDLRYGDVAISVMIQELAVYGTPQRNLVAKVVGGANMFPAIQGRSQKVGEKNLEYIHQFLTNLNIPIASEEIGGSTGRAIEFDLSNGIITIKMTI